VGDESERPAGLNSTRSGSVEVAPNRPPHFHGFVKRALSWSRSWLNTSPRVVGSVCELMAEQQLEGFIEEFAPEMRGFIRDCRVKVQARLPSAVQLVYDNYNFFVIGFSPTRRPSDAILSLAAHRRGVNLCFLQRGPDLPDPGRILRGTGKGVRYVALESPEDLDRDDVHALIEASLQFARTSMDHAEGPEVVIQSVSTKQRPRR
jgi:hypothetical protein